MALPTPSSESTELLLLAQRGEPGAREELARRHRRQAYIFALQLLGNHDDAMDVAQDAMIRFLTTLHRFQAGREVRPWLFAIVRNQVRDLWRRRAVRRYGESDSIDDLARQLSDPGETPEELAERHQQRRRLWQALSRLPAPKREILVLRDYHDLSYAELAKVLDVPLGTVMSRLHAARRDLRRLCQESGLTVARST